MVLLKYLFLYWCSTVRESHAFTSLMSGSPLNILSRTVHTQNTAMNKQMYEIHFYCVA